MTLLYGLLATLALAPAVATAQGVAFAGDGYEANLPAVDDGPKIPTLRGRSASSTDYGLNRTGMYPQRGQMPAQMQAVPREMLVEPTATDATNESSTGLIPKLKRFSLSSIFGDNVPEGPPPAEQMAPYEADRRRPRPTMWSSESQDQGVAEDAKPSRFSLRRLFGDDAAEQSPPARRPVAPTVPNSNAFQNRQPSPPQPNELGRAFPQPMQREQSLLRESQNNAVAPASYTQRSNGLQLRPADNRPAGLFGGGMTHASQTPPRRPQAIPPAARDAGSTGRATQPIFVSDDSQVPTKQPSFAPAEKRPLISSMSPEIPQPNAQSSRAMPRPTVSISSAPLVIENRAAKPQPRQPNVVKNPVPPRTVAHATPAAAPSPRAVELLTDANAFAQSANSEDALTQVVQMCRHVLAIDSASQSVEYSKNLAAWALNRRGELRADAGRNDDAMLDFEDAIHTDPKLWRAVHNRGVMLAQQGQFAAAFDDFNHTVELNPKFAKAYSNRAALYVQAGDLAAALDDYRQAISLDPDLAVAHKGRGRVCHMLGNFEEALQHYDAAVLLAPDDAHMALGRADLLADMGRYAAAIDGYQQAIALDPALDSAYRSLAWVQATCPEELFRDAEQALANAEQALRQSGREDDLTLDTLAAAQAAAGDFAAAQATQQRAIELASDTDRPVYRERLELYQANQPFRIALPQSIRQATYRR